MTNTLLFCLISNMPQQQKTILMPIYHGMRARSIFYTDIYKELIADPNIKIVVVVPSTKMDFYREEHKEKNVVFEPLDIKSEPEIGRVLNRAAFNLLPTSTVRGKQKLYYHRYGNYFKFLLTRTANRVLGPLPISRGAVRFLDKKLVPLNQGVVDLLNKYKPNLVIIPDVVFGPDRIFLRAAKRLNYKVVAMARSWDNLTSKGFVQVLPDRLVVYTPQMVREAIKYVGMSKENIFMSGPPQFDMYFKAPALTRDEFLKKHGIPADKKIILCAPFFDRYTGSAVVMINDLARAIDDGRLPKNTHLLVRYRPGTPAIKDGLLIDSPHITITEPCVKTFEVYNLQTPSEDFEWTKDDVDLLIHSLKYSDVVINTVSTLSVDASAFDKPVINVRFDADPNTPPQHSVMVMLPDHDHYKAIEASGGVKLVGSMDHMISAINDYLRDPKLDAAGREKLRQEQIVFMDGKAGHRITEMIKGEIL